MRGGKTHKTLLSLLTKWYLITLPNRLVNHKAKSSFIGSKLASCLLASHWLYWCISDRPGPLRTLGLRALHIIYPLLTPAVETKAQALFIQVKFLKFHRYDIVIRLIRGIPWGYIRLLIIKPRDIMCCICLALSLLARHLVTATIKGQGESQTINA